MFIRFWFLEFVISLKIRKKKLLLCSNQTQDINKQDNKMVFLSNVIHSKVEGLCSLARLSQEKYDLLFGKILISIPYDFSMKLSWL